MIHMRENTYAVSEVVGALLAITIVMTAIGAVLLWGIPYTEQTKVDASTKNVFNLLSTAVDGTKDMIQEKSGSAREYDIVVDDGSLTIDSTGDRFVIMYDFNNDYNFTVGSLDDDDGNFTIRFINPSPSVDVDSARIFFFSEQSTESKANFPVTPIIKNNNVKLFWDSLHAFENYSYTLIGTYSATPWSSWSTSNTTIYRDLTDDNYVFRVNSIIGTSPAIIFEKQFTVVEGYVDPPGGSFYLSALANPGPLDYSFDCGAGIELTGTIRIDLIDSEPGFPEIVFGRIFLFDLGLVDCSLQSSLGVYKRILENNAIVSIDPSNSQVSKEPIFSINGNSLSLRITQLRNRGTTNSIGPSVDIRLGIILVENYIREQLSSVSDVKMQVYGLHYNTWVDYFKRIHHFNDGSDQYTVELPGSELKTLLLTQSLCTVDFH